MCRKEEKMRKYDFSIWLHQQKFAEKLNSLKIEKEIPKSAKIYRYQLSLIKRTYTCQMQNSQKSISLQYIAPKISLEQNKTGMLLHKKERTRKHFILCNKRSDRSSINGKHLLLESVGAIGEKLHESNVFRYGKLSIIEDIVATT